MNTTDGPTARKWITPSWQVRKAPVGAPPDADKPVDGCMATVKAIRFDGTALPVDELIFQASAEGVKLIVDIRVPNRDADSDVVDWIHIWRSVLCGWEVIESNGPEYLVHFLRETVENVLAHETREALLYDGIRVFDPHRGFPELEDRMRRRT